MITTSLPATMDHSSNIDFPTVPGCTVYLHPSRDPHNTNGYVASRITPFVCHPHPTRNQPPTIRIPQAIPQSTPQAIPQVIPQVIPQAIPQAIPPIYSRHTSTSSSTVEAAT